MERTELADRWTQWFAEYDMGETTRKEFCEARGVKLSTFDYWRQRLRRSEAQKTALKTALKVATVAAQSSTIRILLGIDLRADLDAHVEAAQIREDIGTNFRSD